MSRAAIYRQMCLAFMVLLSAILLSGCSSKTYPAQWGKRLEYKGSSLFYVPSVAEAEARKLGKYLVQQGFFRKGSPGSVQINKAGDIYQFRMVIKEGMDKDAEFIKMTGVFAAQLSRDVFKGKPVEVNLCDGQFKTLRVVAFKIKESQAK